MTKFGNHNGDHGEHTGEFQRIFDRDAAPELRKMSKRNYIVVVFGIATAAAAIVHDVSQTLSRPDQTQVQALQKTIETLQVELRWCFEQQHGRD